jgi:DNA-directed RNA polymerase subunit E'/Rpb7
MQQHGDTRTPRVLHTPKITMPFSVCRLSNIHVKVPPQEMDRTLEAHVLSHARQTFTNRTLCKMWIMHVARVLFMPLGPGPGTTRIGPDTAMEIDVIGGGTDFIVTIDVIGFSLSKGEFTYAHVTQVMPFGVMCRAGGSSIFCSRVNFHGRCTDLVISADGQRFQTERNPALSVGVGSVVYVKVLNEVMAPGKAAACVGVLDDVLLT